MVRNGCSQNVEFGPAGLVEAGVIFVNGGRSDGHEVPGRTGS